MNNAVKILIASRNEENRRRLVSDLSLQDQFLIIGDEKDEVGVIIRSEQLMPDIILIDLEPLKIDILQLASIIKRKAPSASIILMCEYGKYDFYEILKTGIRGIISKEADTEELVIAIKAVNKGGFYSSVLPFTNAPYVNFIKEPPVKASLSLSPAERNIISCIAKGWSDNEIAEYLNYSTGTIRNILSDLKRKTKLKNRTQIVVYSIVYGLIDLENP